MRNEPKAKFLEPNRKRTSGRPECLEFSGLTPGLLRTSKSNPSFPVFLVRVPLFIHRDTISRSFFNALFLIFLHGDTRLRVRWHIASLLRYYSLLFFTADLVVRLWLAARSSTARFSCRLPPHPPPCLILPPSSRWRTGRDQP